MTVVAFYDPGRPTEGDLQLVLVDKLPGDPTRNCVPAYRFKMT